MIQQYSRLILVTTVLAFVAFAHMFATMELGYETVVTPLNSNQETLSVGYSNESTVALSVAVSNPGKLGEEAGTTTTPSLENDQATVPTSVQKAAPSSYSQSAPTAETKKSANIVSTSISGFDYALPAPALNASLKLGN